MSFLRRSAICHLSRYKVNKVDDNGKETTQCFIPENSRAFYLYFNCILNKIKFVRVCFKVLWSIYVKGICIMMKTVSTFLFKRQPFTK